MQRVSPGREESRHVIHIDLFTEVFSPVEIDGRCIGLEDLQELAAQIRRHAHSAHNDPDGSEALDCLEEIARQLELGRLAPFCRQTAPGGVIREDAKLFSMARDTFGDVAASDLVSKLNSLIDYDFRLLTANHDFLQEVATELRCRNIEYCQAHLPHLVPDGGMHTVTAIAESLEANDLGRAIIIRLGEGDKLRSCGKISEYIQAVFGSGFRLQEAYANLQR